MRPSLVAFAAFSLVACSGSSVNSTDQAKQAYLGLDPSIDKAIQLGFAGFNSASSANIAPQTASGADGGTMTVTGQVDQGASNNKGMRLQESLVAYSDDGKLRYDTSTASGFSELDMQLKRIPDGTLTGTLNGIYLMSGDLTGNVTLAVSISSTLQAGAGGLVERKPGTTHITGTATAGDDVFTIDVTK